MFPGVISCPERAQLVACPLFTDLYGRVIDKPTCKEARLEPAYVLQRPLLGFRRTRTIPSRRFRRGRNGS
jgi:hypothetical protein